MISESALVWFHLNYDKNQIDEMMLGEMFGFNFSPFLRVEATLMTSFL